MKHMSTVTFAFFLTPLIVLASFVSDVHSADTIVYDFIQKASTATWSRFTVAGEKLPFPGLPSDKRGFVLFLSNAVLEDGKTYAKVLQTHPEWKDGGRIYGDFAGVAIPANAKLTAKVGFLKGATKSDGVEFQVFMIDPKTNRGTKLIIHGATYDGKLDDIAVDLSSYAGMTQTIRLAVYAKNSSTQDWAVWADAKITAPAMLTMTKPVTTIAKTTSTPEKTMTATTQPVVKVVPKEQTAQKTLPLVKTISKDKTAPTTGIQTFTPIKMKPIILQPVGVPPPKHSIEDMGSLSVIEPLTISDHVYKDTKKPNTYYFIPKEINLVRGRTAGSYKIAAVWTADQKIKTTLSLQANIDPLDVDILEEAMKAKYGSSAMLRSIPYDSANIIDLEGWGDWQIENIRIPSFGSLESEIPINITMTPETLAELKPLLEREGLTAGMHIKTGTIEKAIPIKIGLGYFVGRSYSPLDEIQFAYDSEDSSIILHGVKNLSDFPFTVESVNLRFQFPSQEEVYKGLSCDPPVTITPGESGDVRVKVVPQPILQAELSKLGPAPKQKPKKEAFLDKIMGALEDKLKEKAKDKAEETAKEKGDIDLSEEEQEEAKESVKIDPKWNNFFRSHIKSYWMDISPDHADQEALAKIWENIEVCSYIDRMRKVTIEALENVFDPSSYASGMDVSKVHLEIKSRYLTPQPKESMTSVDLAKDKLKEEVTIYLPPSEEEQFEFDFKMKVVKSTGEAAEYADWTNVVDSLDITIGTSQVEALFE